MYRMILSLVFSCLLLLACSDKGERPQLQIACAASVQFAVKKLANEFSEVHDVDVEMISSSSGKLTTQILNGAPFDIFFAANTFYPDALVKENKVEGRTEVYGYGIPVLWTAYEDINLNDLKEVLESDKIDKIAIADPKNAPYGEMAVSFLSDTGLYRSVEKKLVYGESISQVNEYVLSKNVELAVGAKSIVSSPEINGAGKYQSLDRRYWIPQGMVILKNDNSTKLKHRFFDFVRSEDGQSILEEYGIKHLSE